jgi:hypothetical protein
MKKFIILLFLILISNFCFSQKYYYSVSPSLSFNTPIKEYNSLIGIGVEVGKNYDNYSLGFNTSLWSLDKKDLYSAIVMSVPLGETNFSVSGDLGWFYYYKDITMGYSMSYNIPMGEKNSISISFGDQNAFLSSTKYLALCFSRQF